MNPVPKFHPDAQTISGYNDVADLDAVMVRYGDGKRGIVSCWRPSLRELLYIAFRRRIYLSVLGQSQPPVSLMANPEDVW